MRLDGHPVQSKCALDCFELTHLPLPVGELACSGQQQLAATNTDCFTRGSSDEFELSLPHMGPLHELHICHNGTTPMADWHLDLVIVADTTTGDRCCSSGCTGTLVFACSRLGMKAPTSEHSITVEPASLA